MKIAYIYPALNTIGGADRVITEKANYFAEMHNDEIYIITVHQNNVPIYFPLSPKVKHIDLNVNFLEQYNHCLPVRAYKYFSYLRKYKTLLSELLCSIQPDIVLTTISRDIDFLHSIKDGSKKIAEAHVAKPYLRNIHQLVNRGGIYKIIGKHWIKKMEKNIRKFDALVVLTDRDAQLWKGIKECTVIPNSLPFYPEESSNCMQKKIISVGRLDEQKGYDMLAKAWISIHAKHPDWILAVYGSGRIDEKTNRIIKEYHLKDSFLIVQPVKNIIEKYLESSIYVMSSRFEGFGMVLAEAMACGVPCVSFDCPYGPSDIIKDGEDGFLVDNANVEQLAQKISYLIEHDDERSRMGTRAKENIKRYSREIIMEKWIMLFDQLLHQ
jgi:glycosyltransferase family 4